MTKKTAFTGSAKVSKITYWIATGWLALGMLSTGIIQIIKMEAEADKFSQLGFPLYLLTILGIWKILGVAVILIPRFPVLKEWAYAGFFFAMSGAVFSHIASGSSISELFGPSLLLTLTVLSWHFRPADRKLLSLNK